MIMKNEKVSEIIVQPNKDYVIWPADLTNIVKETTLIVESGCVAMYFVNGMLRSQNPPGRWVINAKDDYRSNSRLQLICANTDMTFTIYCGVGGVPFKDFDLNIETMVGAHGECKIRINKPWQLYATMGRAQVSAEEIDEYIKLKLNELMTTKLAEILQHYDYNNIMTQQSAIADALKKNFAQSLGEIGVDVSSFAMAGIMFSDDYRAKRQEAIDKAEQLKQDKIDRRNREREQRQELDSLIAIANATRDLNPSAGATPQTPPVNPTQPVIVDMTNQPVKYCPRCGTKMAQSSAFCPGCGKKL
jgi:hypothetical protein